MTGPTIRYAPVALAIGDEWAVNDPITGQGANVGSHCALVTASALATAGTVAAEFAAGLEDRAVVVRRSRHRMDELVPQPPPTQVLRLLEIAACDQAMAGAFGLGVRRPRSPRHGAGHSAGDRGAALVGVLVAPIDAATGGVVIPPFSMCPTSRSRCARGGELGVVATNARIRDARAGLGRGLGRIRDDPPADRDDPRGPAARRQHRRVVRSGTHGFRSPRVKVDDPAELDVWREHFEQLGVAHSPIATREYGAVLTFKDPDGIQFEMFYRAGHP